MLRSASPQSPLVGVTDVSRAHPLTPGLIGATEDGDVLVLRMGEKFEVIATNTLADQVFIASPIIAGGELFLRSQNQLFCINEK